MTEFKLFKLKLLFIMNILEEIYKNRVKLSWVEENS